MTWLIRLSMLHSSSNANDTTSRSPARISRRLTLLMTPLAQIVCTGMHDNRTTQYALGPNQFHERVLDAALAVTLTVGLEVAEVADVAVGIGGCAVLFGVRVDWLDTIGEISFAMIFGRKRKRRVGEWEGRMESGTRNQ